MHQLKLTIYLEGVCSMKVVHMGREQQRRGGGGVLHVEGTNAIGYV